MLKVTIIAVGKIKENYLKDALSEYLKRLSRYGKMQVIELPDCKIPPKGTDNDTIMKKEAELILPNIKEGAYVVALCVEGKQLDSPSFAKMLGEVSNTHSEVVFIIGGSLGLHHSVKSRADYKMSFSKLTFPHQLMRVFLAEQIYRCFKINNNETYHK